MHAPRTIERRLQPDYDIDNTNADQETRAHWIALAKRVKLPIRCVVFTASSDLCQHNNTVRGLNAGPDVSGYLNN